MDAYLLRSSVADSGREHLSAEGRRLVRAVGTKLKNGGFADVARFVVAATPAAMQTAELFAERIDYVGVVEVLASLAAGVPPHVAGAELVAGPAPVVVVADEPALSALGAWLVGRPTFPPLRHAQVSAVLNRQPVWYQRADTGERLPLLVA